MSSTRPQVSFEIAGVNALLVRFGEQLDPQLPAYLKALRHYLLQTFPQIIEQVVPAYTSFLVAYDPRQCRMYDLQLLIERALEDVPYSNTADSPSKLVELPVIYGGEYGPDLEDVAKACQMTSDEVIRLHSETTYQVYAQGFAPGFSYLGQLPEALRIARRATPRQSVPAGSVAIAEQQTAVYPNESPGGWQIIGYSPIQWFNPRASQMTPVEVGDEVRFVMMNESQLREWISTHKNTESQL